MRCLYDTGEDYKVATNYDGAVYDIAVGGDCVCGGIGDEFDISYNSTSLQVSFQTGSEAVIGGAFFKCDENKTITLTENSTIYLCARIDKTQPNGQRALFYQNTEQSIQKQNLNGNGTIRDLLLYIVTTSANGVVNVQDMRNIRNQGSQSIGSYAIWVGSTEEEEQKTFDVPTISFTYED